MTAARAASRAAPSRSTPQAPPARRGPRPFLKWVGGKRQLLAALHAHRPQTFGRYFEPFVGGGALFFDLAPSRAVLADCNERLVRAYVGIRDSVDEVIALLRTYPHERDFYLAFRKRPIDARSDAEVAAWFVYLNKTGFNGLYRVNSRNLVNVPFGRYAKPNICDEVTLRACSAALAGARIVHGDFEQGVKGARAGDFVYFDPPYVPLSATSTFTSYTAAGFGLEDQRRLRDVAWQLKKRGVHVLVSNSSAPAVRALYADGFELVEVAAKRAVNSDPTRRGAVTELLIR
jgi:DNA adenine methylase